MEHNKIKTKRSDKNMQDDWLPDSTRRPDATSKELTEYGGDLKEAETLKQDRKLNQQSKKKN